MNVESPVIASCIQGTKAEFEGRIEDARMLYEQAWQQAQDDYEACIAAHYLARYRLPQEALHWNLEALKRAHAVGNERIQAFLPSLYVNLGSSYEAVGNLEEAERFYALAADLGMPHQY